MKQLYNVNTNIRDTHTSMHTLRVLSVSQNVLLRHL